MVSARGLHCIRVLFGWSPPVLSQDRANFFDLLPWRSDFQVDHGGQLRTTSSHSGKQTEPLGNTGGLAHRKRSKTSRRLFGEQKNHLPFLTITPTQNAETFECSFGRIARLAEPEIPGESVPTA